MSLYVVKMALLSEYEGIPIISTSKKQRRVGKAKYSNLFLLSIAIPAIHIAIGNILFHTGSLRLDENTLQGQLLL